MPSIYFQPVPRSKNRASFWLYGDFGKAWGDGCAVVLGEKGAPKCRMARPLDDCFPRRWCHGSRGGALVRLLMAGGLGCAASEVTDNHLGFGHNAIHVITPPLEHLLSLLCELGNDVDGPNANGLMTQSLFDHVPVEPSFR